MSYETFLAETQELLDTAERVLIDMAESPGDNQLVDELFRTIHTLKGASGIFALEGVVHFAHTFENVLDHCRQGQEITPRLQQVFLNSNDTLALLLEESIHQKRGDDPVLLDHLSQELIDRVDMYSGRLARYTPGMNKPNEPLPSATEAAEGCFLFDDEEEETSAEAPPAPEPSTPEPSAEPDAKKKTTNKVALTRVNSQHLDTLIDLIAELLTSSTKVDMISQRLDSSDLNDALTQQQKLLEALHDNALSLRMAEVGEIFVRFRRLVQKLNRELGKNVKLELQGESTEIDKSILDKLTEPLTHMLRNSMDHGVETPDQRRQAGKPKQGTISLRAHHEFGVVLIEVEDDGRGLDRQKILDKAVARGLTSPETSPESPEVLDYIFQPGFSTSATVSNVSGRGVGMDAVKKAVESMRGRVSVRSNKGAGTCFTLKLPTNMALIHGFYVQVHDTTLVLPMEQVMYCDDVSQELQADQDRTGHIHYQDQLLPYINLVHHLDLPECPQPKMMVVVQHSSGQIGLLVHRFLGEYQTVVKPLGPLFHNHPFFNGSTIQGDNTLAVVLDAPSLVDHVLQKTYKEAG